MKVEEARVVEVHFDLCHENGDLIDSTLDGEPFAYLHGANDFVAGVEEALLNFDEGAEFEVKVAPEKGYGIIDPELIMEIPLMEFPEEIDVEVGNEFFLELSDGPQVFRIKEISKDMVLIDGNHELAGATVHFKGRVVSVREATDAEIKHGTASSPCCSGGTCTAEE